MSSEAVRTEINAAIAAAAVPWPIFDLSDYLSLEEVLTEISTEAVLVQYIISDEEVKTISGEGNQGWEETGTVVVHLITPTGWASGPSITKGDSIRRALRGQRLPQSITIESMSPFVDFGSNSVGIDGSVHGYSSPLFYIRRDCG